MIIEELLIGLAAYIGDFLIQLEEKQEVPATTVERELVILLRITRIYFK